MTLDGLAHFAGSSAGSANGHDNAVASRRRPTENELAFVTLQFEGERSEVELRKREFASTEKPCQERHGRDLARNPCQLVRPRRGRPPFRPP